MCVWGSTYLCWRRRCAATGASNRLKIAPSPWQWWRAWPERSHGMSTCLHPIPYHHPSQSSANLTVPPGPLALLVHGARENLSQTSDEIEAGCNKSSPLLLFYDVDTCSTTWWQFIARRWNCRAELPRWTAGYHHVLILDVIFYVCKGTCVWGMEIFLQGKQSIAVSSLKTKCQEVDPYS